MRDKDTLIKLIEVRLDAIANNKYASNAMARQAAQDALNDLKRLKQLIED